MRRGERADGSDEDDLAEASHPRLAVASESSTQALDRFSKCLADECGHAIKDAPTRLDPPSRGDQAVPVTWKMMVLHCGAGGGKCCGVGDAFVGERVQARCTHECW